MRNKLFTYCIICTAISLSSGTLYAQGNLHLRKGNEAYQKNDYKGAADEYQKALNDKSAAVKGKFNLGDAYYRQGQYQQAVDAYQQALSLTKDRTLAAHAYHNIGNSMMQQKKYEDGAKAYESSLLNNPKDEDSRYNLAYAQSKMQQQKQQQKQNQQQQKQNQQQQQKQDQQQKQQEKQDQQKQQQEQQNDISKEDAKRILDAMNNDEKNLQNQMQKKKAVAGKGNIEKNW
jgi:Ca-activated chloride channel family protein